MASAELQPTHLSHFGVSRPTAEVINDFVRPDKSEGQKDEALNLLLIAVHRGQITLHQLVLHLKDCLISTDDLLRSRGTLLLSQLLTRLPDLSFGESASQQIQTLFSFFSARLQDYPSQSAALAGLLALSKFHDITSGVENDVQPVVNILQGISSEVHVASLPHPARHTVLELLLVLVQKYSKQLHSSAVARDYAVAAIQCIDGEKDPRNLLLAFQLIPAITKTLPNEVIKQFAEDLFEVLSVYFPVEFRQSKSDPQSITRDDLAEHLRVALSSTPHFLQFCIPLLMEKIGSELISSQMEGLKTLVQVTEKFKTMVTDEELEEHLAPVWQGLRSHIFENEDEDLTNEALETLGKMTKALGTGLVVTSAASVSGDEETPKFSSSSVVSNFLLPVITECLHHIRKATEDIELRQQSSLVLVHLAKASDQACQQVLSFALSRILDDLATEENPSSQTSLWRAVADILQATIECGIPPSASPAVAEGAVSASSSSSSPSMAVAPCCRSPRIEPVWQF